MLSNLRACSDGKFFSLAFFFLFSKKWIFLKIFLKFSVGVKFRCSSFTSGVQFWWIAFNVDWFLVPAVPVQLLLRWTSAAVKLFWRFFGSGGLEVFSQLMRRIVEITACFPRATIKALWNNTFRLYRVGPRSL
uniref:(northern house mosquito) hypothetical protein n=1 Tax=Culex pipiens TaxID=7175 RepID=A0A8D8IQM2_CULPI